MSNSIREKIKKLLALANDSGATEAEAESAMEMATALMMKYNLSVDLDEERKTTIRGPHVMSNLDDKWHISAASAAAVLYSCRLIVMGGGGFEFVGRPEAIDSVQDLTMFIVNQIEAQYKKHLPKGLSVSDRAEFRRTFKLACATKVHSRAWYIMEQLRNDDTKALQFTGSTALVVKRENELQLKAADEIINSAGLRNTRHRNSKMGSGTLSGIRAANDVQLNKQLG